MVRQVMNAGISSIERYTRRRGATPRNCAARARILQFRTFSALLTPVVVAACIAATGCGRNDPVNEEKSRALSPDERYIVELYMKINDLEKNLQDNPADSLKKWDTLRAEVDSVHVQRALDALERNPERWLGIYNRIVELSTDRR